MRVREAIARRAGRVVSPVAGAYTCRHALARNFALILRDMIRYPAIEPEAFRAKVERFIREWEGERNG